MKTTVSPSLARAAVFSGAGLPFHFEQFAIPCPGAGEVLVKITCSTICGSDLHTWHGRRMEPTPCVLGHEIVGNIIAFGPGAGREDLRGGALVEGDRITWTLAASCGECFYCRRELPQKCESLFKYGHAAIAPGREFSGGFAEYCLLQAGTGIVKLPETLSDELAAPANCAVATITAAHRLAGSVEGASVLILGCGVLGLNAAAMAAHRGAGKVIACDVDPRREELARAFGADVFATPDQLAAVVKEATAGRGADVAMEFSGASAAVVSALASLRTGGIAVIAGTTTPGGVVQVDPNDLVRRMLVVKGLHNYAPQDLVAAIDFLVEAGSRFPFEQLQGDRFPLEEIEAAFVRSTEQGGKRVSLIP